MTTRTTWAGATAGGVSDAALAEMTAAIGRAQSKADAAMTRANSASTAASSASSAASSAAAAANTAQTTASGAAAASSTAAASLDQLNLAIANGDKTHAGFQTAIDALQTRVQTIGLGYAQLTSLLALGGSTDITVPLSRDMGRTDYNVEPSSFPAATLTVKTKTRTSIVLTVKTASLALAVGTPLITVAWI